MVAAEIETTSIVQTCLQGESTWPGVDTNRFYVFLLTFCLPLFSFMFSSRCCFLYWHCTLAQSRAKSARSVSDARPAQNNSARRKRKRHRLFGGANAVIVNVESRRIEMASAALPPKGSMPQSRSNAKSVPKHVSHASSFVSTMVDKTVKLLRKSITFT